MHLAPNLWLCLAAAILAGGVAGALVALFISHRRGIYYALLTIAFGQIFWFVAIKWHSVTRGEDGLLNIKRLPADFGFASFALDRLENLYWFCFAAFVLVVVLLWRLVNAPFGRVLSAIRQNETRARFVGYHVWLYKWLAFVISATLAGLAGATKALVFQLASLTDVHWTMSGEVVLMTLLGGMGTVFGPVIGAAVIITMQNYLAQLGAWVTIVQGVIFVICVLAFRRGIVGELGAWLKKSL